MVALAERFAALWASPETPRGEWLRRLRPLASPEYGAVVLTQVDPADVPAREVVGNGWVTATERGLVRVAVPLDGFTIEVELVAGEPDAEPDAAPGVWLVTGVAPLAGA